MKLLSVAAFCSGITRFTNQDPEDYFVLVGVAKYLKLNPRQTDGGYIYTYKLVNDWSALELVHKTAVEDTPYVCG